MPCINQSQGVGGGKETVSAHWGLRGFSGMQNFQCRDWDWTVSDKPGWLFLYMVACEREKKFSREGESCEPLAANTQQPWEYEFVTWSRGSGFWITTTAELPSLAHLLWRNQSDKETKVGCITCADALFRFHRRAGEMRPLWSE